MVKDTRESSETRSGSVLFATGDAGTSKDVLTTRDEATVSINDVTVTYNESGTSNAEVALYDEPEGTSSGDASNVIDRYEISPGDEIDKIGIAREDIEDDIVAVVAPL